MPNEEDRPLGAVARDIRDRLAQLDDGLIGEDEAFEWFLDRLLHVLDPDLRVTIMQVLADGLVLVGPRVPS